MTEAFKRNAVKVGAWTSWLAALFSTFWITIGFGLMPDDDRRKFGVVVVLFIGIAIRLGQASSRYKLSDTIVGALKTGYDLSEENAKRRLQRTEAHARADEQAAIGRAQKHEERAKQRFEQGMAEMYDKESK